MSMVSVIIPVYNTKPFVEKCIRSVMRQTHHDLEILVIDDGSTDGCSECLDLLAEEDRRIQVFHQENAGVAVARNRGIDAATGEYLVFIDGDDYVGERYIEALYECAEKNQAELVICGLTFVDEKEHILKEIIPGPYIKGEHEEWTFRISAVCSHLYRRELWDRYHIRFYPGERGEDMPISLFFSAVCDKIATISDTGYFYVQHQTSAIHNFRGLRNFSLPYRALEQIIQKCQSVGISNSPDFFELFVLRILSTCLFQLSPGATKEKMKELCDFIMRILKTYFPGYYQNKKAQLFSKLDIPFTQKVAVRVLIFLTRTGFIYPVSRWMAK